VNVVIRKGGRGGVPSRAQFAGAQYVLAPSKPIRRARRSVFEIPCSRAS
jgi:hypothetical protein